MTFTHSPNLFCFLQFLQQIYYKELKDYKILKTILAMGEFKNFQVIKDIKVADRDTLQIKENHINASLNALRFKDADTNQIVSYFPSLDISGYGSDAEKAMELAKFSIREFFSYLLSLSPKKREAELRLPGWKNNKLNHKEFSKAFVDGDGDLKSFAAEGTVERLTVVA